MVHLPDELIISILMRLPVKSVLRFRCVSKSWFSHISDPHFAKSHFELAIVPTYRLLYLPCYAYASQTRSIDLDTGSASAPLNLSFLSPTPNPKIMGSCRGFLLLSHSSNLYLWNPSTGLYKPLPFSPVESNSFLYGFGYDPSTDDYLVVLASYHPKAHLETCFELFSLRANAWEKIEGTHMNPSDDDPRTGTLFNGAIHWLDFRDEVKLDAIVAFDLMERSFSEIPLPDDFSQQDLMFCDLRVLGGFLSLCVCRGDSSDIWVMEQYKVQSSWTKSIVVSVDDLPTRYFSLICSTKNGDIVGVDGSTGLVKFDAKGQLLEHRSYCNDSPLPGCAAAMYRESLLSLPVDNGQAAEDD